MLGFGAGSIIFDQLQTFYINPQNFSPDKPYSSQFPDEKYFSKLHIDLLNRIPKLCLLLGGVYFCLQIIGLCLLCENNDVLNESNSDSNEIEENRRLILNSENDDLEEENSLINKTVKSDTNSLGVR